MNIHGELYQQGSKNMHVKCWLVYKKATIYLVSHSNYKTFSEFFAVWNTLDQSNECINTLSFDLT